MKLIDGDSLAEIFREYQKMVMNERESIVKAARLSQIKWVIMQVECAPEEKQG